MTNEEWDKTEFMLNEVDKDINKYNPKDRAFAKALLLIMQKVRFQIDWDIHRWREVSIDSR